MSSTACGPRSLRHGSACARNGVVHPSPTVFNMAPRSAPTFSINAFKPTKLNANVVLHTEICSGVCVCVQEMPWLAVSDFPANRATVHVGAERLAAPVRWLGQVSLAAASWLLA